MRKHWFFLGLRRKNLLNLVFFFGISAKASKWVRCDFVKKTAKLQKSKYFLMSEKPPTRSPLQGDLLAKAITAMQVPSFFMRLASVVQAEANKRGLLQGQILPGGEDCAGIAVRIASAICEGCRQWKNPEKTEFFSACCSAVRSVVGNWQGKACNFFEWTSFEAACENWEEEESLGVFPASPEPTPHQSAISRESLEHEQGEILALLDMVESNTLDSRMVELLYDDPDIRNRAEIISLTGCSGREYDASIKRIQRLATKIKLQRSESK